MILFDLILLARCVDVLLEGLRRFVSFRFVSKQRETSNAMGMSSLIF